MSKLASQRPPLVKEMFLVEDQEITQSCLRNAYPKAFIIVFVLVLRDFIQVWTDCVKKLNYASCWTGTLVTGYPGNF